MIIINYHKGQCLRRETETAVDNSATTKKDLLELTALTLEMDYFLGHIHMYEYIQSIPKWEAH